MNSKIAALIVGIGFLAGTPAMAECAAGQCTDVKITGVYLTGDESNYIMTSGTETNLSCDPVGGQYILLPTTKAKSDWLFSYALSAHMSGATVSVRTSEAGTCSVTYIVTRP